ncbi:hypothetical protein B0H14DRAFT_3084086 [Mycena olivaceomarginata]|nr:hypothetical protein B0H14DRAFT_3084086 [Mycena olivaceomarginata]
MEEGNGSGRGSFIWGRSVHNTRIERLWYDVTHGFGKKWKVFFLNLETNHGLNPTRSGHIWLLHHLFLASEAWNFHQLTVRRQRERSPRDLFLLECFARDLVVNDEPNLIAHLLESNPHERATNSDPFASASTPANLSEVLCDPPGCPITPAQLLRLEEQLPHRLTCSLEI